MAISHLSACGNFHQDIATCNAEALARFCDEATAPVLDSFKFVGCCITLEHLDGIKRLNAEGQRTRHHPISVEREYPDGVEFILLSWLASTPRELVKAHVKIDESVLAKVSTQKTPVVGS